jgi:hypothetical protein
MVLDSPIISGSATFLGNLVVTGSITTSGSITISGSIASASYATNTTTASYAVNATTASYANIATSASYAANASNSTLFNSTSSTVFATTGSNTFVGTAYHSNTNDATAFSGTTASIYTDGGLQVTKNAYFSSSVYVKGNFTIYGTQSVNYITSSQLNIATNLITVNTSTPSIRFGGIAVQDSGSVNGLTGSLLWDSQTNNWIYSNPSGSGNYDSAMVLMGPTNNGGLGNEVGIGVNYLAKGAGGHHMTSSGIYESGSNVGIGTTNPGYKLSVITTGTGALTAQATNATVGAPMLDFYDNGRSQETVISSTDGTTVGTYIASYSNHPLLFGSYANSAPTAKMVIATNGKVGIGTSSPDNTYQGLTIYGANPSLRLKTNEGGGWTWTEYVNSSGTNNFSIGVNQSVPFFGIKAGAGLDNPNFVMTSGGNIGIGTITPSTILELSTSSPKITLTPTAYSGNYRTILGTRSGAEGVLQFGNNGPNFIVGGNTGAGGSLHFYVNASSDFVTSANGTLAMVLASSGNAGIGTSSPADKLEIYSSTYNKIKTYFPSTYISGFLFSDYYGGIKYDAGNDRLTLFANYAGDAEITFDTVSTERMRISSAGNVGINDTAPSTRLSINGANYVEMATFTCTNAAAATIITDNGGYVQFSLGTARHCSNSSLFVPVTDGIKITKSGIVHISFSQDITTTGTTGYVAGYIQKNKNNISENLITNTNGQWDGINGVGTINVAADDVINFSFNAGDITSFDPGSWSQYSFVWTSR